MTTTSGVFQRGSDEPMAFTAWECIRGALFAWIIFMIGAELAYAIDAATPVPGLVYESAGWTGGPMYTGEALFWFRVALAPLIIGPISMLLTCVLAPVGAFLGTRLRTVRSLYAHACAYLALGAIIGGSWWVLWPLNWVTPASPFGIGVAIAAAFAAPIGWASTAYLALRRDRPAVWRPARNTAGPLVEDAS